MWAGVASVFRDYGYRRLRHRARIKFLIADWGPERFREVLEKEYLGYALADGPAPGAPRGGVRDHVGVHPQGNGLSYVGFAPRVGRLDADALDAIADLADRYGSGRVRTTTEQKMVILDVPAGQVDDLVAELEAADLQVNPSPFRRHTMACTGIEFCKLAIVETKAARGRPDRRAGAAAARLHRAGHDQRERLPELLRPHPDRGHRPEGLAGHRAGRPAGGGIPGPPGRQPGGGDGSESGFGRKVRGLKTTADELPDYVERVLQPVHGQSASRARRFAALDRTGQRRGSLVSTRGRPSRSTAPTAARRISSRRESSMGIGTAVAAPAVSSYALPE